MFQRIRHNQRVERATAVSHLELKTSRLTPGPEPYLARCRLVIGIADDVHYSLLEAQLHAQQTFLRHPAVPGPPQDKCEHILIALQHRRKHTPGLLHSQAPFSLSLQQKNRY